MSERIEDIIAAAHKYVGSVRFRPGDAVVIISSTNTYPPIRDAILGAVISHGVDPVLIVIKNRGPIGMEVPQAAVDCCCNADVVIDLQIHDWAYSDSRNKVIHTMDAKGGVYQDFEALEEDVDNFCNLGPNQVMQERTSRISAIVDNAKLIRIKSEDGTDLEVLRGDRVDRPIFKPQGQVGFSPPEDGVNGTMMYKGACRVQGPSLIKQMVYRPARIEWEKGKIANIARDTEFGAFLDDWLDSMRQPAAYQFAHINFGVDHRVKIHGCDSAAVHYNYGGILVGVGTNYSARFGKRSVKTRSHVDLQWVGQSAWIDGKHVLDEGQYTPSSGIHAGEERQV